MSTLSTKLKEARAAAQLTQDQLAKKAKNGLTANDISKAERDLYVPTDAQLKAIAKATGVTQKSLLDAKGPAKKPAASAAKKPAASTAAKKPAASTAKTAGTSMKVTATEKKLVEAYRKASAENKKLARENEELIQQLAKAQQRLRQARIDTTATDRHPGYTLTPAEVVKISRNKQHNYIILNRGYEDGIQEKSGIITPYGVVGIIDARTTTSPSAPAWAWKEAVASWSGTASTPTEPCSRRFPSSTITSRETPCIPAVTPCSFPRTFRWA